MKASSTIKPPVTTKFLIEQTGNGKCNVHFYENIEQKTTEDEWKVLAAHGHFLGLSKR